MKLDGCNTITSFSGVLEQVMSVSTGLHVHVYVWCCCFCCCSASNYLLGLTPVQLGPLVVGTVAGMSVWSILYASLGGASRTLLESGADLDVLLAGGTRQATCLITDMAVADMQC